MATPVVTETWAGTLDCSAAACRRKRLTADQFSKKAVDLYNKQGKPLRCKQCVESAAARERELAAASAAAASVKITSNSNNPVKSTKTTPATTTTSNETAAPTKTDVTITTRTCAACHTESQAVAYNKNQWNKGDGLSRCRACVDAAVAADAACQNSAAADKLAAAQRAVDEASAAKSSGNNVSAIARLQAESALSALQAESVTGLKPVRMGSRAAAAGSSARRPGRAFARTGGRGRR